VLRAEIIGTVKVNSKLSGMPELRLGLNDKIQFEASNTEKKENSSRGTVELEDVKFHQCVRLTRFEVDRVITFVPPDGEFILMSYRLNTTVKPLFWIDTHVTKHSKNRVEYLIKAKSQYKPQSTASNVEITVPVPSDASAPTFSCSMGSCKYVPEKDAVVWFVKQFPGLKEPTMRVQYTLPSVRDEESPDKRPPVTVKVEIPYYTVSGIQVRYLKIIEKSGYASLPWVRYLCASGDYQFRI
jgi:AP-1 complex subunit mu